LTGSGLEGLALRPAVRARTAIHPGNLGPRLRYGSAQADSAVTTAAIGDRALTVDHVEPSEILAASARRLTSRCVTLDSETNLESPDELLIASSRSRTSGPGFLGRRRCGHRHRRSRPAATGTAPALGDLGADRRRWTAGRWPGPRRHRTVVPGPTTACPGPTDLVGDCTDTAGFWTGLLRHDAGRRGSGPARPTHRRWPIRTVHSRRLRSDRVGGTTAGGPRRGPAPAVGASAQRACLAAVSGEPTAAALALDYARYDGRPALVIVLAGHGSTGRRDIYVVGPGCGPADVDLRSFLRVAPAQ